MDNDPEDAMLNIDPAPLLATHQITLPWLQAALQQGGYRFGPAITNLAVENEDGKWSSNARLLLGYENGREMEWPTSLFLKMAGGPGSLFGDTEVRYYAALAAPVPDAPLPRCYHVAYSPQSQHYHLLLEDLSDSHSPTWEKHWAPEDAATLALAFAKWHAAWWDNPNLSTVVAPLPSDAILARYLQSARQGLEPLLEAVKGRISPEEQDLIRRVYDRHPRLMEARARSGRHFTCIHGDPNPGNILWPHSMPGRCYLIDRQPFDWSLQTWIGASDLAYMMVHWWPTEMRQAVQTPLLKQYHGYLVELGVQDYSWEELWHDYQLAALQSFYVVGNWCSQPRQMAKAEWVWWPQLQKTLQTYIDLGCNALLDRHQS